METMTCKDLTGACDLEFHAETFGEIAEMSKKHEMEMFEQGDQAHQDAMGIMKKWFESVQETFDALPEN